MIQKFRFVSILVYNRYKREKVKVNNVTEATSAAMN